MLTFQFAFDYSLAAIVVAGMVCITVLWLYKIRARDSRTALAIELGELRSRISTLSDQRHHDNHRIIDLENYRKKQDGQR